MKTVLITGGNGFLGYYLIKQLLYKNYRVVATGKGESRYDFQQANFLFEPLDFTNEQDAKNVFEKHKPDIIVHAGALSKPDDCEQNKETAFKINVTGTTNLLKKALKHKSFFIFISTDFVFDGETGFYKENDIRSPVNYYGETKLLAENEVMKYKHEWALVRTVLVYGKTFSGRDNIVSNVAKALKKGEHLKIFDDQVRTPTYVEDLAAGILLILEKKAKGIYHISGEDVRTPYQMAIAVAEFLNLDKSLITKATSETFQQPAKRPAKTGLDIAKAKKDLDFQPVSFKEGLRRTFEDQ